MPENKGIPKTITLDGKEYILADHPELMSLVTAGRKDEKDKLYATIQSNEAAIKVLQDEKKASGELTKKQETDLKKLQDELAVAKTDLEKATKDTDPKPADPKEKDTKTGITIEDVTKAVADALKTQAEEFEQKISGVKGDLSKKTVEDYRKEVLEKNKGLLIDALVPEGLATVEEVNKAVETALKTSKDYIRKDYKAADGKMENLTLAEIEEREAAAKPPAPAAGGTYVPPPAPPAPAAGTGDLTGKELTKDLGKMDQATYNKNRDAIRQEILKVNYGEE